MKAGILVLGLIIGAAAGWFTITKHPGRFGLTAGSAKTSPFSNRDLFELDGKTYREVDLPPEVASNLFEARMENFTRIEQLINEFGLHMAIAKEKDPAAKADKLPSFAELLAVPKPTEDEIKQLFEANKARLPPNTTFETVKPEIEKFVVDSKTKEAMRSKMEEFKAKNRLKLMATEPQAPLVNLNYAQFPSKGKAPVVLLEASDYLCPHCQATQPEVEEVLKEIGDRVTFVQVPYALRPTNLSGTLARGAICAAAQGEAFWKYHEAGYKIAQEKAWKSTDPDNADAAKEVAKQAGLDAAKFDACLVSAETKTHLDQVLSDMEKAGVNGTPTFFLNGRKLLLHGATLKDAVKAAIQAQSH